MELPGGGSRVDEAACGGEAADFESGELQVELQVE